MALVVTLPTIKVWPSGFARAISSTAMMPFAPGLFSTTTGWPSVWRICSAMMRATMSVAPPGAYGTRILTGLSG